jgi:hypothetical protein
LTRTIDFFLLVILILDGGKVNGGVIRKDKTAWLQVLIASKQNGIEHGFIEQEIAHPFGDYDVVLLNW